MPQPKILVALGSPSDKELLKNISLDESVDLYLSIASAHRTPADVAWHHISKDWDAIIVGAGLTNALLSEYVKHAKPETLVFGLPINDDATSGLSSVLSSQELPPGYVAAIVGVNQLSKACELAKKFVCQPYKSIALLDPYTDADARKKISLLEKLGVFYRVIDETKGNYALQEECVLAIVKEPSDVTVFCSRFNCVIATCMESPHNTFYYKDGYAGYMRKIHEQNNAAFVGFKSPTNLALFGAKVISRNNPAVAEQIREYTEDGKKKYAPFNDVIQLTQESLSNI